ncbi:MAG: hypothetical protein IGS03_04045 [Candidatus Sericytochromatia bacterium]|nr:hypothetical protein [Candidatus Sericytochromatia bacterium]
MYVQSTSPYSSVQTNSFNPYVQSPVVADDSQLSSGFSGDFANVSSMLANAAGGGFAAHKVGAQMGTNLKGLFGNGFKGFFGGMKNVALTGAKGAGLSALVSAGVSAVSNGVGVATGKVDSGQAVSNVVKDTIGGAVGGLTAAGAAGVGHLAMNAVGMTGTIGTVVTVGLGVVGGVVGGQLAKKMTDGF